MFFVYLTPPPPFLASPLYTADKPNLFWPRCNANMSRRISSICVHLIIFLLHASLNLIRRSRQNENEVYTRLFELFNTLMPPQHRVFINTLQQTSQTASCYSISPPPHFTTRHLSPVGQRVCILLNSEAAFPRAHLLSLQGSNINWNIIYSH